MKFILPSTISYTLKFILSDSTQIEDGASDKVCNIRYSNLNFNPKDFLCVCTGQRWYGIGILNLDGFDFIIALISVSYLRKSC